MAMCSVTYEPSEEQPCAYDCKVMRQFSLVEFELRIFGDAKQHLVEVRHMRGCRYAFSEASEDLAKELKVSFPGAGKPLARAPPALNLADSLLNMPSLKRASSSDPSSLNQTAKENASSFRSIARITDTQEPASPGTACEMDETCTCAHVMRLLDAQASGAMRCQGCRAAGAMAQSLCENMQSCELKGVNCGADHKNHHLLFAQGGPWVEIAQRVASLAQGDAVAEGYLLEHEEEEVRAVAMAAVATISQLQHVCATWLSSAVAVAVLGCTESDASPHVKREALRATEALASRDKQLAIEVVKAGAVPALELEADGGAGGQPLDLAAQRFAQGALRACRA